MNDLRPCAYCGTWVNENKMYAKKRMFGSILFYCTEFCYNRFKLLEFGKEKKNDSD